ncbi:hypothetical protein DFH09DRAFT_1293551 [Mycena vulgaris]|nr:hypothetical protein DFH09DRAFT_1293551 [Mycena vulgaris]
MSVMLTKFESKSNRVKGARLYISSHSYLNVRQVLAIHPSQPLLAAAVQNGSIQLWNYRMGVRSTVSKNMKVLSAPLISIGARIHQINHCGPASSGPRGKDGKDSAQENPVARLKLLLLASFLGLHMLNLSAPLTSPLRAPSAAVAHTTPLNRSLLALLTPTQVHSSTSDDESAEPRLLVCLSPPLMLRPARPLSRRRVLSLHINTVLSAWTHLVGDPVLSKGIVVVLAISVLPNVYLIRGVGRARGGVRFEDGREAAKEHSEEAPAVKAEPKSEPETAQGSWARDIAIASTSVLAAPVVQPISIVHHVDRRLRTRGRGQRSRTPARRIVAVPSDESDNDEDVEDELEREPRPLPELVALLESAPKSSGPREMSGEEVVLLGRAGKVAGYALEKVLAPVQEPAGLERAVRVRRALISRASHPQSLETSLVPFEWYDFAKVLGACCENVVGYIPIPFGITGPLNIDSVSFYIPVATARGSLVASTSRGCKALGRDDAQTAMAGRALFVRFATATGDAMGMNMGTEEALELMQLEFPEMVVLALSGNYCIPGSLSPRTMKLNRIPSGRTLQAQVYSWEERVYSLLGDTPSVLKHPSIAPSLTYLLITSQDLDTFFIVLDIPSRNALTTAHRLLRSVDRCSRINDLPGISPDENTGVLAALIRVHFPVLEQLNLDCRKLGAENLGARTVITGATSFLLRRPKALHQEYESWWNSQDGAVF